MEAGGFYYNPAPSKAQRRQLEAQLLALAEEKAEKQQAKRAKASQAGHVGVEYIERTVSIDSAQSGNSGASGIHRRNNSYGGIGMATLQSSRSSSSSQSDAGHQYLLSHPYELRHGRRFLRELPYPLPVDLPEIQRQNLRTLLSNQVFGRPVCSPSVAQKVPKKVLEIGCGGAYWSALCHDHFLRLGYPDVAFVGLDVAPLAPNFNLQGMNWKFVQHDVRRLPLPFDDEEFGLIMLKDLSLVLPSGPPFQKFLDETIRLLQPGGTLEIWESDHIVRSLAQRPPPPSSKQLFEGRIAEHTATFLVPPGTQFVPAQNKYMRQANTWITDALDARKLPPTPCVRIAQLLYQEPDFLGDVGTRRVAIPLSELRWEREAFKHARSNSDMVDSPMRQKARSREWPLRPDQAAIRQTALLTVLQNIESMEPMLKEASGKNSEEWSYWWASMMTDLLDPAKGALNGECLEVGAWWATKLAPS